MSGAHGLKQNHENLAMISDVCDISNRGWLNATAPGPNLAQMPPF